MEEMELIEFEFEYDNYTFLYIQKTFLKKWLVESEVYAISEDAQELLKDNYFNYDCFQYGRSLFLDTRNNPVMVPNDVTDINEGDIVLFQQYECIVLKKMFFGSKHPYYLLGGKSEYSDSVRAKIGKNPVSYTLLRKVFSSEN